MYSWIRTWSVVIVFILIVVAVIYGYPQYKVWQQRLAGQAELARAEQNRKIAIQEAEAKKRKCQSSGRSRSDPRRRRCQSQQNNR